MNSRLAFVVAALGSIATLTAQDAVHFVTADRVTVRAMRDVPSIDVAPGVHVRTVVGTTGSFSLGDFDSGGVAPLHHHTREQADFGIAGTFDVTLGSQVESVGPGTGFIVPANVAHSIANKRGGVATIIEFHTVRRPDLVPPRPAMTFPSSAEPVALDHKLATHLDGPSESPSRIAAATCVMGWRQLQAGAGTTDLHGGATPAELFAYVVRGDTELLMAEGAPQRVTAGTLIVIPAAAVGVRMRAAGTTAAVIVDFSPAPVPHK